MKAIIFLLACVNFLSIYAHVNIGLGTDYLFLSAVITFFIVFVCFFYSVFSDKENALLKENINLKQSLNEMTVQYRNTKKALEYESLKVKQLESFNHEFDEDRYPRH